MREVSAHVQNDNRSVAAEIFAIGTYFPNRPHIMQIKSRRMRWAKHVACMGEESVHGLMGKPEGKRPLGRPCHRWEDGIRMDHGEIVWGGL
jgi:hypothetical protein